MKKLILIIGFLFSIINLSYAQQWDGENGSSTTISEALWRTGKVGIGTTTLDANSALTVAGDINTTTGYRIGGKVIFSIIGTYNTFLGEEAGLLNGAGFQNTYIGYRAGYNNVDGESNTFLGYNSGYLSVGNNNTFIGTTSGQNAIGSGNFFMGTGAGITAEGDHNMYFGYSTGSNFKNGNSNVFLGYNSGSSSSIGGDNNVFIGKETGYNFVSGKDNILMGNGTGGKASGDDQIFIGRSAGNFSEGNNNIFIGLRAGAGTSDALSLHNTGTNNVFIGKESGLNNYTGTKNTFVGYNAGMNNTTGSNNLFIGANSGSSYTNSDSDKLDIGGAIFGDLTVGSQKIGIGTSTLEANSALTVGGNLTVNGTINGIDISNINSSFWNQDQTDNDLTYATGNVVVGTNSEAKDLYVHGMINTTRVKVEATITVPDYVFAEDYKLPTLQETEKYIKENHHLPEIPSAKEIEKDGIDLGEMNLKLLKKIEELTLHMIELQKKNQALEERMNQLGKE